MTFNTYTGNMFAVDPNSGYTASRSSYGNGISPQNLMGPPGMGATETVSQNSVGNYQVTNYGISLGQSSLAFAQVIDIALSPRTYSQMGQQNINYNAGFISSFGKLSLAFLESIGLGKFAQWAAARFGMTKAARSNGKGDLTQAEINQIQDVVNQAGRPLDVVGSAAKGSRRGVGSNAPVGKGEGTKSDIDYVAPPSSLPNFNDLQNKLPGIDPKTGIFPGVPNPHIGPSIRFEPK